jgi:hypothetical protein
MIIFHGNVRAAQILPHQSSYKQEEEEQPPWHAFSNIWGRPEQSRPTSGLCQHGGERYILPPTHPPSANPFSSSSSSCICYLAHDTKINMTASVVVSSTIRPKLGQSHDWSYQIFQSFFFLCQNHHHQPPIQSNYWLPWQCDAVKLNKKKWINNFVSDRPIVCTS